MPYVEVWVDAESVDLEDYSSADLHAELARRAKQKGDHHTNNPADYRIPGKAAESALDDASQVLRKLGRVDLAFKLDEIRVDFLGH